MNHSHCYLKKALIARTFLSRFRNLSYTISKSAPAPVVDSLRNYSTSNSSSVESSRKPVISPPSDEKKVEITYPESSSPAGTLLRGLNYLKGHDDPISLKEEEYPTWLWSLLDEKKNDETNENDDSDIFAKSKKLRRKAAKKRRKLEALKLNSGEVIEVKVPLTQQSIDLPSNEQKELSGATLATNSRIELRAAMRNERRKSIKERNYLKSV